MPHPIDRIPVHHLARNQEAAVVPVLPLRLVRFALHREPQTNPGHPLVLPLEAVVLHRDDPNPDRWLHVPSHEPLTNPDAHLHVVLPVHLVRAVPPAHVLDRAVALVPDPVLDPTRAVDQPPDLHADLVPDLDRQPNGLPVHARHLVHVLVRAAAQHALHPAHDHAPSPARSLAVAHEVRPARDPEAEVPPNSTRNDIYEKVKTNKKFNLDEYFYCSILFVTISQHLWN